MNVDWSNPRNRVSKYFNVHEALWLPTWQIYHTPTQSQKIAIMEFFGKIDIIRQGIGTSGIVHTSVRPLSVDCPDSVYHGESYNAFIGSSDSSGHTYDKGQKAATDMHFAKYAGAEGCAEARQIILDKGWLDELELRMEDIDGSWIHFDNKDVISRRFFKP